jgi:hypothetical protein
MAGHRYLEAMTDSRLSDSLIEAPVGVTLLARLEGDARGLVFHDGLESCDESGVGAAAEGVRRTSFGTLVSLAVGEASMRAGPWSPYSARALTFAYRFSRRRRPIAEAMEEHFGAQLEAPFSPGSQQWWAGPGERAAPTFGDFSKVYGNGAFPWNGLWTVTDPPVEVHDDLVGAWELDDPGTSRWHLPVEREARVWTIDRPLDWVQLVEAYPKVATRPHDGWELPGPNQHRRQLAGLGTEPGQRAVRTRIDRQVLPDWDGVAADYDGVHLSWAGFVTSEGYVSDLPSGGVTMLRYWGSERTVWLRDVFGEPAFLDAPSLTGVNVGVDLSSDRSRREGDLAALLGRLGRQVR